MSYFDPVRTPKLLGVAEFETQHLLGFANLGVELVRDKRPIRVCKLNVVHGAE